MQLGLYWPLGATVADRERALTAKAMKSFIVKIPSETVINLSGEEEKAYF